MSQQPKRLWHLARNGKQLGAFTSQELSDKGKAGEITSDMEVWRDGMKGWQSVSRVKGLAVVAVPASPPPPRPPAVTVAVAASPHSEPMPVRGHVTTERTSKRLKMEQLLAVIMTTVGVGMVFSGVSAGVPSSGGIFATMAGLGWLAVTRMRVWWHHG